MSGHVVAGHGRGVVTGRGPVAGVVALRSARSGATTKVMTSDARGLPSCRPAATG